MICIYEANETDWHGNGLCILQPSSCTVGGLIRLVEKGVTRFAPLREVEMLAHQLAHGFDFDRLGILPHNAKKHKPTGRNSGAFPSEYRKLPESYNAFCLLARCEF